MVGREYPVIPSEVEGSPEVTLKISRRGPPTFARDDQKKHSLQNQPPAQDSFRAHNLTKFQQIFFHRFADDGVAAIAPVLHLARSRFQTGLDLLRRFSAAFG